MIAALSNAFWYLQCNAESSIQGRRIPKPRDATAAAVPVPAAEASESPPPSAACPPLPVPVRSHKKKVPPAAKPLAGPKTPKAVTKGKGDFDSF